MPCRSALALLLLAACIERAPGSGSNTRRAQFDRTAAASYLAPGATPARRVGGIFGGAIELVGVDVDPPELHAGQPATVVFYWRAADELDGSWKVFVHLDGQGEAQERINGDHWPTGGAFPTDVWKRGDVIRDAIRFTLPASYRGEALDVWVGWYNGDERLPLTNDGQVRHDGNNRLLAATLPVR